MNVDVMDALRNLLNDDVTIQGYLGGTDRVVIGWINADTVVPCITLWEADESSIRRPCYNADKHRDNTPVIHIDTWINTRCGRFPQTSLDLNKIADYAEGLLFDPAQGVKSASGVIPAWTTRCWQRTSSNEPGPETVSGYSHKSRSYSFEYSLQD